MIIKIRKSDFLKILRENRQKHISSFNIAKKSYLKDAEALLNQRINMLDDDFNSFNLFFSLSKPVSHVDEFDKIITFVKFSPYGYLELNPSDHKKFILNEWHNIGIGNESSIWESLGFLEIE